MSKFPWGPLALVGGGALLLGNKQVRTSLYDAGQSLVKFGQELAFRAALPQVLKQYSDLFLEVAQRFNLDPWVLAAVAYRESNGGAALDADMTGDYGPRFPPNRWASLANPATGLPPDGLGWGRGLMQLDYGAHNAWVIENDWRNPLVNMTRAAEILSDAFTFFEGRAPVAGLTDGNQVTVQTWVAKKVGGTPGIYAEPRPLKGEVLTRAVLDSYNAGAGQVLQVVAMGKESQLATTGADYSEWSLTRVAQWVSKFNATV